LAYGDTHATHIQAEGTAKFQDGDRIVSHTVDERTYTLHVVGVPVKSLRQFEGTLSDEDAEAMLKAIREDFGPHDE